MKQYLYNLGVLLSISFNVIVLFGSPHESTSMRVARELYAENNEGLGWVLAGRLINGLFFWEENHLKDALDGEDHANDLGIFG